MKSETTKGERTKKNILDQALALVGVNGLESTSIGDLAKATGLSRSGLFAHFDSKEQMQIDVLKRAADLFIEAVILPCNEVAEPNDRLKRLAKIWPEWYDRTDPKIEGGCVFLNAITEFDDQPGVVRDFLYAQQQDFLKYIAKTFREGQERKQFLKEIEPQQFAYEFYSLYMGFQYYRRFFDSAKAKPRLHKSIEALMRRSSSG